MIEGIHDTGNLENDMQEAGSRKQERITLTLPWCH